MKKNKSRHGKAAKAGHADISKQHGKPIDPADMPVYDMKGRPTQQHQGSQLGTIPEQMTMPQTMQGPADYPGQEIGA